MHTPPEALPPLQFSPVLKDYPWGGQRIGSVLGRSVPPGPIAESWEISAHIDGPTPVRSGRFEGRGIQELMVEYGERMIGSRNSTALDRGRFPLLVKVLDSNEWLSVQVHPDDSFALEHEGDLGKTEMWVVLDAAQEAEILLGFKPGVDAQTFREAIALGTAADCLHPVRARTGDVFFVPPGTVHAIGPGLLIAEIQQSSNVTYRVFDWNREPARPLHVDASLEVLDFAVVEPEAIEPQPLAAPGLELLAECPYFRAERLELESGAEFESRPDGSTFEIWGTVSGCARLEAVGSTVHLPAVSWVLLPAETESYRLRAREATQLLRVFTPPADGGFHGLANPL